MTNFDFPTPEIQLGHTRNPTGRVVRVLVWAVPQTRNPTGRALFGYLPTPEIKHLYSITKDMCTITLQRIKRYWPNYLWASSWYSSIPITGRARETEKCESGLCGKWKRLQSHSQYWQRMSGGCESAKYLESVSSDQGRLKGELANTFRVGISRQLSLP